MTDENGFCRLYGRRSEYELTSAAHTASLTLKKEMFPASVCL